MIHCGRYYVHLLPRCWTWGRSAAYWDFDYQGFCFGPLVLVLWKEKTGRCWRTDQ
jgi:hypothetical protein